MANNDYAIEKLARNGQTVVRTDDGRGKDWLILTGVFDGVSDIRLSYEYDGRASVSASGLYQSAPGESSRLVVNGLIENVRGSNGADFITGNEAGNILFGDAKSTGSGMGDTMNGGAGEDTMYGGAGNDDVGGGEGRDLLFGNRGDDTIVGGGGKDTIEGGKGADSLAGGADVGDTLTFAASTKAVVVDLTYGATTTASGGDAEGDRISGFTNVVGSVGDDRITDTAERTISFDYNKNTFEGGDGDDRLTLGGGEDRGFGGDGDDTILGERDRDTIDGGAGRDVLSGGSSGDLFVFDDGDSGRSTRTADVITDFKHESSDTIDLKAIDAITGGRDSRFRFIGTDAFGKHAGELRYDIKDGDTFIRGDLDGDGATDLVIMLEGKHALVASDFVL